jgi:hypothetical protein
VRIGRRRRGCDVSQSLAHASGWDGPHTCRSKTPATGSSAQKKSFSLNDQKLGTVKNGVELGTLWRSYADGASRRLTPQISAPQRFVRCDTGIKCTGSSHSVLALPDGSFANGLGGVSVVTDAFANLRHHLRLLVAHLAMDGGRCEDRFPGVN